MTGALLLIGWMVVGVWSARAGLPSGERALVWALAGAIFGPLWWLVRVDRPSMLVHRDEIAVMIRHEAVDDVDRACVA